MVGAAVPETTIRDGDLGGGEDEVGLPGIDRRAAGGARSSEALGDGVSAAAPFRGRCPAGRGGSSSYRWPRSRRTGHASARARFLPYGLGDPFRNLSASRGGTELPICAWTDARRPTNSKSSGNVKRRLQLGRHGGAGSPSGTARRSGPGCAWIVGDGLSGVELQQERPVPARHSKIGSGCPAPLCSGGSFHPAGCRPGGEPTGRERPLRARAR